MIEKFFIFVFTPDCGWLEAADSYAFTAGKEPKVLVVQNQEEHDYCVGLAYMYGCMPEIIIYTPDYMPQSDCLFGREVIATKLLLF